MATRQLLSLRGFVPDSLGNPARTAYMHIFEPGTQTRVTSFKDGALQISNVNPVPMSAAGKASVWVSRDVDVLITLGPLVTDPVLVDEPNANPDVAGGISSGLVPNGSFENDSDADDVPDGWVEVAEVGSNNGIDNAVSSDGLQSFRFTSVGTGGGSLTTIDFFVVNDIEDLRVNFDIISSVVDVRNIVRVEWYDISQVPISNTDVYDNAVSNPLVFTPQTTLATPPAGARFAKLRLIGCDPSDITPGSTWYDRVSVFYPLVVSGVFDNITIQNNEIISTNADGRIQLRPNGNGGVDVTSDGTVDLAGIENPLNVGNVDDPAANPHIAFDATQLQGKADGTNAAALGINLLGGLLSVGSLQVNNVLAELLNTAATATNLRARNSVGGISTALDSVADGSIVQTDAAGAAEDVWIALTRNGGVSLRFNNTEFFTLTGSGTDSIGTVHNHQFQFDGDVRTSFYNSQGGLAILARGTGNSSVTTLNQTTNTGTTQKVWVTFNRDGAVELHTNSILRFATTTSGAKAFGNVFELDNSGAGTDTLNRLFNSLGGFVVQVDTSGNVLLRQTSSAGASEDSWIDLTRNGAVGIRHNNIAVARSALVASGGFEVNNTVTGAGFERVLTTSDIGSGSPVQGVAKQNLTQRNNTIVNADDDELVGLTLEPSSEYTLEGVLSFQGNGGTAQGFRVAFDFNGQAANVEEFNGSMYSYEASGGLESIFTRIAGGGTILTKPTFDNAGNREIVVFQFSIITQSDFVGGTAVDLQWAQGTSNATNTNLEQASFYKLTKMA